MTMLTPDPGVVTEPGPPVPPTNGTLLDIRSLVVAASRSAGSSTILDGVDLTVRRGETVGLVGESGSGKSMLSKAVVGLLPDGVEQLSGSITFDGVDLDDLSPRARAGYRGDRMTLLFQDPFTSLNPLLRCGKHITEGLRLQAGKRVPRAEGRADAIARLAEVGIADPSVVDRYPFQLSGGMRQRVALAAALARDPQLLLADEPSTALDVTTQAEILELLRRTQEARGMSMIFITHDLRVAFSVCDRVYVLYAGSVLETGNARDLQRGPMHPYTHGLLLSEPTAHRRQRELRSIEGTVPRPDDVVDRCPFAPRCRWVADECRAARPGLLPVSADRSSRCIRLDDVLDDMRRDQRTISGDDETSPASAGAVPDPIAVISDVHKSFVVSRGRHVHALRGVSLAIGRGESVGLVGESGSGKTTLGRCTVGLEHVTSGSIRLHGRDVEAIDPQDPRARRLVQIIFQDPYSSLDPRQRIGDALAEPLRQGGMAGGDARRKVGDLLRTVGLPDSYVRRRPGALSGGERQRIAIARALSVEPQLLVCDEPVSALDVSVQAQILKLFRTLRDELGLSLLFITHDLAVVRQVVDTVHILYRGEVVEAGPVDDVMDRPQHDYTRRLIASIPGEEHDMTASPEPVGATERTAHERGLP
jgi:oligopeptide/dipeptide ABC transporter ATP-binding protein